MIPEFLSPGRLWVLLVLPVLIVAYILVLRAKRRQTLRFNNLTLLDKVLGKPNRWVRHLSVAMSLCSLAALALAWAQPLGVEKVPRERATVVMVVDVSQSMAATDISPDRISAARSAAQQFIQALPEKFNTAVVKLSGQPSIVMPPSTDRPVVLQAIERLQLEDGTNLESALQLALQAVNQAPQADGAEEQIPAMIVVLSDGDSTTGGDPLAVAEEAKGRKIPIHTIAYGTENGYVDLDGKRENVAPDTKTLAEVSKLTGGQSLGAKSASQLDNVYKEIGSSVGYEEVKKPITAQYAFGALGFAVIAALGAVMMAARWP